MVSSNGGGHPKKKRKPSAFGGYQYSVQPHSAFPSRGELSETISVVSVPILGPETYDDVVTGRISSRGDYVSIKDAISAQRVLNSVSETIEESLEGPKPVKKLPDELL